MDGSDFRLPGFEVPLRSPQSYVTSVMRNFDVASQALGAATSLLVVRLSPEGVEGEPNYQIQTLDGEDAAAFSGATHELLYDDITRHIEEKALQIQTYTLDDVRSWLDEINGEGRPGGPLSPGLDASFEDTDSDSPRYR